MEGSVRTSKNYSNLEYFCKKSMIRFSAYDTLENYKGNLKFMQNKKPYLMKKEI